MVSESSLRRDLQAAMKAQDKTTTYVLRGVIAAVSNLKIEKGIAELSEADILGLVQREAKKREEAEEFARAAGRADLVEQNAAELVILRRYLPRALDDGELENVLRAWVAEGVTGIGPLMARLKERYSGQYDGKRASELARSLLASG